MFWSFLTGTPATLQEAPESAPSLYQLWQTPTNSISHTYISPEIMIDNQDTQTDIKTGEYHVVPSNTYSMIIRQLDQNGVVFDQHDDILVLFTVYNASSHDDHEPDYIYVKTKNSKYAFAIDIDYVRIDDKDNWGKQVILNPLSDKDSFDPIIDAIYKGKLNHIRKIYKKYQAFSPYSESGGGYSAERFVIKDGKVIPPSHQWNLGRMCFHKNQPRK